MAAEIDLGINPNSVQQINGLANAVGSLRQEVNQLPKDSQASFGSAGSYANILSGDMNNLSLTLTAVHTQLRDYLPSGINKAIDGFQGLGNYVTNMFNGAGGNPLEMLEGQISNIGNLLGAGSIQAGLGGLFSMFGGSGLAAMEPFINGLDKINCEIDHMGDKEPETLPCPKLDCDNIPVNVNVKSNVRQAEEEIEGTLKEIPNDIPVNISTSFAPGIGQLIGQLNSIPKNLPVTISTSFAPGVPQILTTLATIPTTILPVVKPNVDAGSLGKVQTDLATIPTTILPVIKPNVDSGALGKTHTDINTITAQVIMLQALAKLPSVFNILPGPTIPLTAAQIIGVKTLAAMPTMLNIQAPTQSLTLANQAIYMTRNNAASGIFAQVQSNGNQVFSQIAQKFIQTKQLIESNPIQAGVGQAGDNSNAYNALNQWANQIGQVGSGGGSWEGSNDWSGSGTGNGAHSIGMDKLQDYSSVYGIVANPLSLFDGGHTQGDFNGSGKWKWMPDNPLQAALAAFNVLSLGSLSGIGIGAGAAEGAVEAGALGGGAALTGGEAAGAGLGNVVEAQWWRELAGVGDLPAGGGVYGGLEGAGAEAGALGSGASGSQLLLPAGNSSLSQFFSNTFADQLGQAIAKAGGQKILVEIAPKGDLVSQGLEASVSQYADWGSYSVGGY